MSRYAENTVVKVEKTQAEIVSLLKRYKADSHGFAMEGRVAKVMFRFGDIRVLFTMFVPTADDPKFRNAKTWKSDKRQEKADQEERRLWRSLLLVIKAKLESVDSGIETLEEAFLAQTVLPNGETLAMFHREFLKPAIASGKFQAICDKSEDVTEARHE